MTVGYMRDASSAGILTLLRLLFRWKGSVWKMVGHELCFWLWTYLTLSIAYRFGLKGTTAGIAFERLVVYCNGYVSTAQASLSFVLGFYVSVVATRWWNIFMRLPWPDSLCLMTAALLRSQGEKHRREERVQRRTIVRYLVLAVVMVFRNISERIRKRFPELDYLKSCLITAEELEVIHTAEAAEKACVFWLPLMWIMKIYKRAYEEHGTLDEAHLVAVLEELRKYRDCLNDLLSYDWICTPLVYTQVVNLATTFYMGVLLVSSQFLALSDKEVQLHGIGPEDRLKYQVDYVIPLFAVFQFIFYVGWLKVAQVELNPFGLDDDDFEVDFLIERNLKIGYAMMDELFDVAPALVDTGVVALPHTKASAKHIHNANPMIGSVANLKVPSRAAEIVTPPKTRDETKHSALLDRLGFFMPRIDGGAGNEQRLLDRLPATDPSPSSSGAISTAGRVSELPRTEAVEQATQSMVGTARGGGGGAQVAPKSDDNKGVGGTVVPELSRPEAKPEAAVKAEIPKVEAKLETKREMPKAETLKMPETPAPTPTPAPAIPKDPVPNPSPEVKEDKTAHVEKEGSHEEAPPPLRPPMSPRRLSTPKRAQTPVEADRRSIRPPVSVKRRNEAPQGTERKRVEPSAIEKTQDTRFGSVRPGIRESRRL